VGLLHYLFQERSPSLGSMWVLVFMCNLCVMEKDSFGDILVLCGLLCGLVFVWLLLHMCVWFMRGSLCFTEGRWKSDAMRLRVCEGYISCRVAVGFEGVFL
jgi:hypothetical protein